MLLGLTLDLDPISCILNWLGYGFWNVSLETLLTSGDTIKETHN